MDKIYIRNLKAATTIGTIPEERLVLREVTFNIVLECDMRPAARTDDLTLAVNYQEVHDRILALCSQSGFYLIETLAEAVAELCLTFGGVKQVMVTLDKPGALSRCDSVAVEIVRSK